MEFSEFKVMQPWQLGKLQKQSQAFSEADLSKIFLRLAALDEEIKTGALTLNLSKHLDILLLSDLNYDS